MCAFNMPDYASTRLNNTLSSIPHLMNRDLFMFVCILFKLFVYVKCFCFCSYMQKHNVLYCEHKTSTKQTETMFLEFVTEK